MFQCTASCKYTMLKTSKRCWRVRKVNEVPMIFQFYANPSPIHSFVFSWIAGCGRDVLKYSCYSHIYIYIIILFSCNWQWLALSELSCQLILNLFPQRQHHRQTQQERTADLFWTSWANKSRVWRLTWKEGCLYIWKYRACLTVNFQVPPHTELYTVNCKLQLQTTGSWSGLRKNEAGWSSHGSDVFQANDEWVPSQSPLCLAITITCT